MTVEMLEKRLAEYKAGTFIRIEWERDVSSAKAKKNGTTVMKHCEGLVRLAINYSNIQSVMDSLATLDPNEVRKESWFEHCEGSRFLVQSKRDATKKYIQLFTVADHKISSTMFVGGVERNAQELYEEGLITKAALPQTDTEELVTMTLGIENIIAIGA